LYQGYQGQGLTGGSRNIRASTGRHQEPDCIRSVKFDQSVTQSRHTRLGRHWASDDTFREYGGRVLEAMFKQLINDVDFTGFLIT